MTPPTEKLNADPALDAISIHRTDPAHTSVEVPMLCLATVTMTTTVGIDAVGGGTEPLVVA
ncbi:hypothetical protein ACFY05_40235 [Microtetraspora fusca]|uniref:Uncharacterized protein n=1 Tax=Microtetraspora fusca TaxID=1997 RepID=A0ABW6VIA0_MICFU